MSRRGKRLREFEKNNRTFNISEAREKRAQKYSYLETKRNEENVAIEETRTAERKKKKSKIVNMKRFVASVISRGLVPIKFLCSK